MMIIVFKKGTEQSEINVVKEKIPYIPTITTNNTAFIQNPLKFSLSLFTIVTDWIPRFIF